MDLTQCTSTELCEFGDGYSAARFGQPFDPSQSLFWQEGYRFRLQIEVESSQPPTLH